MKKIIIISDKQHIVHVIDILNLSSKQFDIVSIFCSGKELFEISGFETLSLDNLLDIQTMEYDYIININSYTNQINNILVKFISIDAILNYKTFSEFALTPSERMHLLKLQMLRAYPNKHTDVLTIGDFSYGMPAIHTSNAEIKCTIGKFCSIGPETKIFLNLDHQPNCCTTFPFNALMPHFPDITEHPFSKGNVNIGNDVWLGNGVTILSGVSIGDGCVIGANTVVARSIPPYSIVVGNPGRIIKKRFTDEQILKLQEMKWWDWEYEVIYNAIPILQSRDIDQLYKYWKEL